MGAENCVIPTLFLQLFGYGLNQILCLCDTKGTIQLQLERAIESTAGLDHFRESILEAPTERWSLRIPAFVG